jgi:hypothetical protein
MLILLESFGAKLFCHRWADILSKVIQNISLIYVLLVNLTTCLINEGIRGSGGIAPHIHNHDIDGDVPGKIDDNKVLGSIAGVCTDF